MALPLTERPPSKPPVPTTNDSNTAARYKARWDTPMPISSAEERRAPAAAPPPSMEEMYQARWDTPMPQTTDGTKPPPTGPAATGADVAKLISALTGMKPGTMAKAADKPQPFDVNGVDRAKGLLEAATQAQQAAGSDYTQVTTPQEFHGSWDAYGAKAVPSAPTGADKIARAEQGVADAERAQRKHAIGADKKDGSGRKPISKRTDRMTAEEYAALGETERAAVDFNAMLVQAVRTDRKNEDTYDPSAEQKATYDAGVDMMFGEDGGSKRYAPATMALLGQLGYQDDAGDLDDFLRLKAAVKEKDLARLDPQGEMVAVPGMKGKQEVLGPPVQRQADGDVLNPVQYDRVQLAGTLAAKTAVLQEQLAKGSALLQTMNATAAADRNPRIELLGGVPNTPKVAAGYGPPTDASGATTMDGYFAKAIDYLSDPKIDSGQIVKNIQGATTPEQFQAFLAFARTKADQAKRYGVALSNVPEGRSVEEFEKLLATIGGAS